jgi:hypothetical protein
MTWRGERRNFVSYEPDKKKLETAKSRTWDYGRTPKWWEKVRRLEGCEYSCGWSWCDHEGQISDSDIVCTNPYHLSPDEAAEIKALADKYGFDVDITGASPWYPGRTVAIELQATEETYRRLKLTPPADAAFYQSYDHKIRQKRKVLTGGEMTEPQPSCS